MSLRSTMPLFNPAAIFVRTCASLGMLPVIMHYLWTKMSYIFLLWELGSGSTCNEFVQFIARLETLGSNYLILWLFYYHFFAIKIVQIIEILIWDICLDIKTIVDSIHVAVLWVKDEFTVTMIWNYWISAVLR